MQHTIAECKTRLEAEGFLVIPKERVLKLEGQRTIDDLMLKSMQDEAGWKQHATDSMGRDLGHLIVRNNACILDELKLREAHYGPTTTIRLSARVIVPKPEVQ